MSKLINILNEFFYALTGAVVIFVGLELAWKRVILAYFNINWLLILWLIIGIVILLIKPKKNNKFNDKID